MDEVTNGELFQAVSN